jgi:hypothetical protein
MEMSGQLFVPAALLRQEQQVVVVIVQELQLRLCGEVSLENVRS